MPTLQTIANIDIAAPGTRQRVSATVLEATAACFQADPANTGNVYVGDGNVAAGRGQALAPGSSWSATGDLDLSQFYCDTDTAHNKLRTTYFIRP